MSNNTTIEKRESNSRMLRAMVGIGIICSLLIVLTYEGTLPRVERLKAEALQSAIFRVLPGTETTKTYYFNKDNILVSDENLIKDASPVYAGYDDDNELVGLAIQADGQGYADVIKILYGYDPVNEKVIGFQVLESKETPGLGDKIEKDENFKANFKNMDVSLNEDKSTKLHQVVTVKSGTKTNSWEVDGITGATISSRAIASIIDASTEKWGPVLQNQIGVFTKELADE